MLVAESLDELDVLGFSAGLVEDAEMGLSSVESFGALAQTSGETVVDLELRNAISIGSHHQHNQQAD